MTTTRFALVTVSGSEVDFGRSITCDGHFLYMTNSAGKSLAKIGSGLHGTLR